MSSRLSGNASKYRMVNLRLSWWHGVLVAVSVLGGFVFSYSTGTRSSPLPTLTSLVTREGVPLKEVNPLASERPQWWEKEVVQKTPEVDRCVQLDTPQMLRCLGNQLRAMSQKRGARFALDVIQPIAQQHPGEIFRYNHELAHVIGDGATQYSYPVGDSDSTSSQDGFSQSDMELINRIGRALADCDGWGAFGCYHGVIEVGLAKLPVQKRTIVVKKACLENSSIQSHRAFINQCLHWFGHGMAIFTSQTLAETLEICESLNASFNHDDVQLCVSGVFHAGAQPGESDASLLHNISRVYSRDDVYYPCDLVPQRYKRQCYSQVPGRTGPDLKKQATNCNNLKEKDPVLRVNYIHWCYNSYANNVLVTADFDAAKTVQMCRDYALLRYRKYCYEGAVRYAILRDPLLNNRVPFQICELAEPEAKPLCYTGLGAANVENYFSPQVLTKFCQGVTEEMYAENCLMRQTPEDFGKLL